MFVEKKSFLFSSNAKWILLFTLSMMCFKPSRSQQDLESNLRIESQQAQSPPHHAHSTAGPAPLRRVLVRHLRLLFSVEVIGGVQVPEQCPEAFMKAAELNTKRNKKTCAILAGVLEGNDFVVTHVFDGAFLLPALFIVIMSQTNLCSRISDLRNRTTQKSDTITMNSVLIH